MKAILPLLPLAPFPPAPDVFSRARSSKTGAMTRQGPQVALVKNATVTRWLARRLWKLAVLLAIWIGAATVCVLGVLVPEGEVAARCATACNNDAAGEGFCVAAAAAGGSCGAGAGVGAAPGTGRRNIESMVGRSAAPKGVLRKSLGKSLM